MSTSAAPGGSEPETRARAREILKRVLLAVYDALSGVLNSNPSEERTKAFRELLGVQDEVATRVYFALGGNRQVDGAEPEIDDSGRRVLYFELKSIVELLTSRAELPGPHHLAPHTAHYLMETMNEVLPFDPSGQPDWRRGSYLHSSFYDELSIRFDGCSRQTVKLVDKILADYKDLLRDNGAASALGAILDIFVRAGWPQALQLTFTLDRAMR